MASSRRYPPPPGLGQSESTPSEDLADPSTMYEPPALVELGDFTELTCGLGFDSLDAVDYYSSFSFGS